MVSELGRGRGKSLVCDNLHRALLGRYSSGATTGQLLKGAAPTMISGVIGIYGLVVSTLIATRLNDTMPLLDGYRAFAAGTTSGLGCLFSGIVLGTAVKQMHIEDGKKKQKAISTSSIVLLVLLEATVLYSLIVGSPHHAPW
mmetsp:Transcript_14152/g.25299  ORF Transcript_14152/g.25299 Transcript_14152/m.25299 type:complete len:142 (+) Transcript_14152:109-534(+)|eukprot:CAMPEP_0184553408 /NCGR_PEP_ID=MMETSP0199_2-20130426/32048_1 /TAXON_ID=1112570 /ORGANISM="Thraustochytrium sp., Strain LLF1b" /LENGTH=141 /DNA_ID=CAMNT_0026949175 /DNA_START=73 /DNA_END=498 /DNA_ORIENTATION=-